MECMFTASGLATGFQKCSKTGSVLSICNFTCSDSFQFLAFAKAVKQNTTKTGGLTDSMVIWSHIEGMALFLNTGLKGYYGKPSECFVSSPV